jgi:nitrogen fixation/metabolism regulation signal transduction histidine kinase
MAWRVRKPLKVFTRGVSLRRRVAYSLAIVRLILAPVIFLAIYYLFRMGYIVDRIVSVDAPAATLSEKVSMEMLDARRAERNFFLLHDPKDLEANRQSIGHVRQLVDSINELQPEEQPTTQEMQKQVEVYEARLNEAASRMGQPALGPVGRIREVVRAYEKNLEQVLKDSNRQSRAKLIEDLQERIGSLDSQITRTLVAEDPALLQITKDLQSSSDQVLKLAPQLESRSWNRVMLDHQQARDLIRRAEWVLGIVSTLVILLSVWVSFVLPREAVRPLSDLKDAVDHAAAGNYEVEFDVQGEGEVVQLAHSIRNLIEHIREKLETEVTGHRR